MPSPPRTVFDGLEGMWERSQDDWRKANQRREAVEAANVRAQRDATDAVLKGVQRVMREVRAGVDRAMVRAGETQPGKVVDALFGTTAPQVRSDRGSVDYAKVDERRRQIRAGLQTGLDGARRSDAPEAAAGVLPAVGVNWYRLVKPYGEWDDRGQAELANKNLPPERRADPNKLEYQGNFSYGATAEALGIPKNIALFAGGLVQRKSNLENALAGRPLKASEGHFYPPYGDDPYDQRAISDGYDYGRKRARDRR